MMERSLKRELYFVGLASAGAMLLNFSSWLPLVFILPTVLTFNVNAPAFYLGLFALLAELLTTSPVGVMTAAVFAPWFIKLLVKEEVVDLSLTFGAVVVFVLIVQFGLLLAPEIVNLGPRIIPWSLWPRLLIIATVVYLSSVLIHFNRTW